MAVKLCMCPFEYFFMIVKSSKFTIVKKLVFQKLSRNNQHLYLEHLCTIVNVFSPNAYL